MSENSKKDMDLEKFPSDFTESTFIEAAPSYSQLLESISQNFSEQDFQDLDLNPELNYSGELFESIQTPKLKFQKQRQPQSFRSELLPQSKEAELAVLGVALSGEDALNQIYGQIDEDDFYIPLHKLIYQAIKECVTSNCSVDPVTVWENLKSKGLQGTVGGFTYISELKAKAPLLKNARHYANIVSNKATLRRLISILHDVEADAYIAEDANKILDLAAASIFSLRKSKSINGMKPLSKTLDEVAEDIHKSLLGKNDQNLLKTGYPSLDRALGGFKPGSLNIIAARPGMGKSALAINIAHKLALHFGKSCAIFSLEMGDTEIAKRMLSSEAQIEASILSDPKNKLDWNLLSEAYKRLYKTKIFINDNAASSPIEILAKCRQLKMEHDLSLVIVDYLQLMNADSRGDFNRQQQISEISRNLKLAAKELEIPIIALSQLSRACDARRDKRPVLSDLRESGSIEQDADTVLFIYRENYYTGRESDEMDFQSQNQVQDPNEESMVEIIIAKNRAGKQATVQLAWIPQYTLFLDKDAHHELPPSEYIGKLQPKEFIDEIDSQNVPAFSFDEDSQNSDDLERFNDVQPPELPFNPYEDPDAF